MSMVVRRERFVFLFHNLPIDPVQRYILSLQPIFPILMRAVEATRAILEHAEKKHFLWSLLVFTPNLELVVIPHFCPCESI
jgi:hypothetical protein